MKSTGVWGVRKVMRHWNPSILRRAVFAVFTLTASLHADTPLASFDQANRLYEQGKYTEAATAYENLLPSLPASAALYFNLGNAWYKAGQSGRAIAAYRQAEKLAPRDPNLRFNLNFVRKKVSGSDSIAAEGWQHWFASLTLNEWTGLATGAVWVWFLLLALREARPVLKKSLGGYTATTGAATMILLAALATAICEQYRVKEAVVIATNAVVRYGPLEESHVYYQLRDGSEVNVLDEKELTLGQKKQAWLQVQEQDGTRRIGWVQRDQVILLAAAQNIWPVSRYVSR
jgi:tetratricopeptide (TPR) repeat protein